MYVLYLIFCPKSFDIYTDKDHIMYSLEAKSTAFGMEKNTKLFRKKSKAYQNVFNY